MTKGEYKGYKYAFEENAIHKHLKIGCVMKGNKEIVFRENDEDRMTDAEFEAAIHKSINKLVA